MKIKELRDFNEKIKEIDPDFEVDAQFMIFHNTPAARKQYRENDYFIEIAIYYNYMKNLVTRISKNKVLSDGDGCMLSTSVETIKEEFQEVKQQSKKNVLAKIQEVKNIDLKALI
jgi:hypothetical protein